MKLSKRIAVIGAGIAGNGAAWALANGSEHEVTVFEASSRPGGHSATVDIDYDGAAISADTGFIVYNLTTMGSAAFFSNGRFNLLSFYQRDHLPSPLATPAPLVARARAPFAERGSDVEACRIMLLCLPRLPRVFGYAFNPISVFYAIDKIEAPKHFSGARHLRVNGRRSERWSAPHTEEAIPCFTFSTHGS